MTPVYIINGDHSEWFPGESKPAVEVGHIDEEQRFRGTINSTARLLRWQKEGLLSGEDFVDGLKKNADHLGMAPDALLDLAAMELDRQEQEKK